jgi:ArsR family transcriptional regulator
MPTSSSSERVTLTPQEFQAISRALADPRRFEILQQIAANDSLLCGQLHAQDTISPATISHHLKELQEAGLVESERNGRQMCLRLRRPVWNAYLTHLQQL